MGALKGLGALVRRELAKITVLAGAGLFAYGVSLIFVPAGLIVGGIALVVVGVLLVDVPTSRSQ